MRQSNLAIVNRQGSSSGITVQLSSFLHFLYHQPAQWDRFFSGPGWIPEREAFCPLLVTEEVLFRSLESPLDVVVILTLLEVEAPQRLSSLRSVWMNGPKWGRQPCLWFSTSCYCASSFSSLLTVVSDPFGRGGGRGRGRRSEGRTGIIWSVLKWADDVLCTWQLGRFLFFFFLKWTLFFSWQT